MIQHLSLYNHYSKPILNMRIQKRQDKDVVPKNPLSEHKGDCFIGLMQVLQHQNL